MQDHLEWLAQAAAVAPRIGDVVVGAVVFEGGLAAEHLPDHIDVLAGTLHRLAVGDTVPAFDDLRPGHAETEAESAVGEMVHRGCGLCRESW